MTPDQVARYDAKMKKADHNLLLEMDRLFFSMSDKKAIGKLKAAAQELMKTRGLLQDEEKAAWEAALGKQMRQSVDRAKKSAG